MLIDAAWERRALEAHRGAPPGRVYCLLDAIGAIGADDSGDGEDGPGSERGPQAAPVVVREQFMVCADCKASLPANNANFPPRRKRLQPGAGALCRSCKKRADGRDYYARLKKQAAALGLSVEAFRAGRAAAGKGVDPDEFVTVPRACVELRLSPGAIVYLGNDLETEIVRRLTLIGSKPGSAHAVQINSWRRGDVYSMAGEILDRSFGHLIARRSS